MTSFSNSYHPSNGLSSDINVFIEEFKLKKSFQFLDFCEVWRNQEFFELIYGRGSMSLIKDFLNCLFHYLVDLIQNTSCKYTQTCSLFMMYAFYGKLPSKNVFFRVTLPQWKTINELVQFYRVEEHLDCLYIFNCLCTWGAFHFCATRQPNFPNIPLYANLDNIKSIMFKSDKHNSAEEKNDSYVTNSLDKIAATFDKYYASKKELFPIAANSLGLLHEHYVDDIISCYKESISKTSVENICLQENSDERNVKSEKNIMPKKARGDINKNKRLKLV